MNSIQITLVTLFFLFLSQWSLIYYGIKRDCTDPFDKTKLLNCIKLLLGVTVLTDLAFLIIAMSIHLAHSL